MSEPAHDIPAEQPRLLARAIDDARRGVITHLTIGGQRVAVVVPESVIEALRAAEDAQNAAEAEMAIDEPGESIALEDLEAEFGL